MESGTRETLVAIVEQCLAMDRLAVTVYRALAANTPNRELAAFWREMSAEEQTHVAAWTDLLALMFDREIPNLFQNPERTLFELAAQHEQVRAASAEYLSAREVPAQFLAAFRLEFYLLHPALERLWHFYQLLRRTGHTPEDAYESHLRKFITAMERWGAASPELQLLGTAVMRLWTQMRELSHEATVDVLTRVLNRRGLLSHVRMLAYLSRRNEFTAGALMVDVDHFKRINDTHGHQAGDEVLASVAGLISGAVRRSDVVGRYGGEEFLVFLPQIEPGALAVLGEKVRGAVESGTRSWIPATVSVGAACTGFAEGVEPGLETLIRAADRQLYVAKSAGRNAVAALPC
jgi:diguanylate cyclase (GGDEF)-like protein